MFGHLVTSYVVVQLLRIVYKYLYCTIQHKYTAPAVWMVASRNQAIFKLPFHTRGGGLMFACTLSRSSSLVADSLGRSSRFGAIRERHQQWDRAEFALPQGEKVSNQLQPASQFRTCPFRWIYRNV